MRIPLTKHVSNEEFLERIDTHRALILNTRKRSFKLLGYKIRKDGLEGLTLIGHTEDKVRGETFHKLPNKFV